MTSNGVHIPADAADVLRALRRVRRASSEVHRIVYDRLFDSDPALSAAQLAAQRGVSYETVRKVAASLTQRVGDAVGEPLGRLAATASADLGDTPAAGAAVAAAAAWFPAAGRHRVLARRLLVQRLGYVTSAGFDLSPLTAAAVDACRSAARRGDADGVLAAARIAGRDTPAVMEAAGVEVWCGRVWRRGTHSAAAAAAFERLGSPLSTDQLIEATGLTDRQVRSTLSARTGFGRAGWRLWTLAAADAATYTSIAAEARRHIEAGGGSAAEADVIADVAARRGVSPGSVRTILGRSPAFEISNGVVSLRRLPAQPAGGGRARHRFRCEPQYLRGYSIRVPAQFAEALGVAPGGRTLVPVQEPAGARDVSLIWRATSHTGPELGRAREALQTLGARPGDTITVAADNGRVLFEPPVQAPPVGGDAGIRSRRRPPARICAHEPCGREFQPGVDSARYCSPKCRSAAGWATRKTLYQQRRGGKAVYARPTKTCANEQCGREFHPTTSQKTCSEPCRRLHQAQQRKRGPIRRCAGCGGYYREREGHKNCCTPECYAFVEAGMDWDLLGRGCLLAVLVLVADESAGGGYATSESVSDRLGVTRSNALRHLAALQRAGLATRSTPVSHKSGSLPHEFRSTVPMSSVAALVPSVNERSSRWPRPALGRPSSGQTCGCWQH